MRVFRSGKNFLVSACQFPSRDVGHTTSVGEFSFLRRWMRERVWRVLPSPMSSARSAAPSWVARWCSQAMPSSW